MTDHDGRHDFDFFHGDWTTRNRKLVDGFDRTCTEWVEFDSAVHCEPVLGGLGNIEPLTAAAVPPSHEPLAALTLRVYDPGAATWKLYWISTRQLSGLDDGPMVGAFTGPHGEFHCVEEHDGATVHVRWDWDDLGDGRARWQQFFSWDAAATWTLTWRADHTRG